MAGKVQQLTHQAERQAISVMLDGFLKHLKSKEDRTETYLKIVDLAEKFYGAGANKDTLNAVREYVKNPENRWMRFINRVVDETDHHYAKTMLLNLGYEAFFRGTKTIRENRKKYNCNIPWLILFDPTMACNLHCVGCWSGTYGHKSSLTFEEMDKIVTEGKELGAHLYMLTGGEPTVRMNDIFKLAEKHNDCFFGLYSNSTLINDEMAERVRQLGNITFMLSIEGTEETNDARRGSGHYEAAMKAMDILKKHGIVFGTSICYTRANVEAVTSDAFFHLLEEKGARFGFYFHLMPVGNNAVPELMPTVEQRKYMIDRIRYVRSPESNIEFFPMDFQNDGEYVGGCIAGGRNYFHINSNGDAEPCVFIHFSNTNIKNNTILEMLQSPLFMAYHEGQPFNRNQLRPCPMLENPQLLREMVQATGAHQTNLESPEDVDHLCAKCDDYAKEWAPVADEIWASETHKKPSYENYTQEKREHPELAAFEHADGSVRIDV
ncbi:Radical SAM superfamily enzyme, MoaA/NifB/PqqE/SkfB family [Lachnospiraceae bacterium NK3A20]|jgi:MoaA/NifB/PqqE/SkfB family radical SAM enzyme|nr:Radical SAM superfamily enzyme, MoaA/NifB/PqqE/SkfB family [Lachnospiraceae bacterium NK3A20]